MSKFFYLPALYIALLLAGSCKKNTSEAYCKNCLPPLTDTGANTFGCLVNGQLLLPQAKTGSMSIPLQCTYQWVDGKIFFSLRGTDFINKIAAGVNIDNVIVDGLSKFEFNEPLIGNIYGMSNCCGDLISPPHFTLNGSPGELFFTRFDTVKQIASGTFWYDAVDTAAHDTVRVRDGRFDVHFTR